MAEMMQAVQYSSYGGAHAALQHKEIPIPVPKKGEILVKVEAASVNPVDWKMQGGVMRPMLPAKFPHTPGTDIAGEVVKVGSEVKDFAPGDKVVAWLELKHGGAMAQYAVANPKTTVVRPPEVSAVEAACLPVAALTALQALTSGGMNFDGSYSGNVLVTGASGGVGTYAVQLGKIAGAHVTATCGERNIELIKFLGADEVLDYKTPEGKKLISPSGKKYDLVVNAAASAVTFSDMQPQLAPKGVVFELTPSPKTFLTSVIKRVSMSKQKYNQLMLNVEARNLEMLVGFVKEGKLHAVIDSKFPLAKVEEAWKKSKEGHAVGKIVITVTEE
ncbi:chloroplastic oxoene reductase [Marchantia polymorpha subsp. ruderalis]|uniref:Enoyl reductase (ER) domain-containing protein n=2 Tax=Marchantia polymorpha TaxID=3197 RepID=A0AAF6AS94_MARPO|nr:hypothetical protein MARPO_0001s0375 [Marchantia polymorpha]BBM99314.1 hypothetical protein Mp_1g20380 [Marchantia polymorpha subsp. ruderalis]|eukprot:PTQ50398.1 hypothetical protein MARPO_0001s0375 [Marchantia polymorpha]